LRRLRRIETLWHLSWAAEHDTREAVNPAHQRLGRMSPFPPEHVNAPTFLRSRCLPLERTCANALSSAHEERLPPLACGGRHRTCSSTFENLD
jgi:hypothetical protein